MNSAWLNKNASAGEPDDTVKTDQEQAQVACGGRCSRLSYPEACSYVLTFNLFLRPSSFFRFQFQTRAHKPTRAASDIS